MSLNVDVALRYIEAWLAGRGAVAIHDLMEDAATAEISRTQLRQWVRHGSVLQDATVVTREVVLDEIEAQVGALTVAGLDPVRLQTAAALVRAVALADDLPPFLTTLAQEHLQ